MPTLGNQSLCMGSTEALSVLRLAAQDFAFESNEQRMRAAAHLMASSLAGAYAMNQCREPMRASLGSQLHALLKPNLDPPVGCWRMRLIVFVHVAHVVSGVMRYLGMCETSNAPVLPRSGPCDTCVELLAWKAHDSAEAKPTETINAVHAAWA